MTKVFAAALLLAVWAAGVHAQEGMPSGVQVGGSLPALSGVDLDGKPVSLSQFPEKVTVVLAFWSLHCGDCIRELDDLRSMRREFPREQLALVAVNTDSGVPVERVADFVHRYERTRGGSFEVLHLLDRNTAILETLGIRYIPLLIVADNTGRVSSVVSGYSPEDKERVTRAVDEGRIALGGWTGGLRARVRTLLRSPAGEGELVEWGSFRVEEGLSLFGLYDSQGWLTDAVGRRDRGAEARRVEAVLADRWRVSVLRASLASVGIRLPAPGHASPSARGFEVPESPLSGDTNWKRLYDALGFEQLFREESRSAQWIRDDYYLGAVADVDLGLLRRRLELLGFPSSPSRIRVEALTDFDFKARAAFEALQRTSYRLQAVEGQEVLYFGEAARLADDLRALELKGVQIFAEALSPGLVRLEVL